ncbi:MAG: hypothetical protein IPI79_02795 [Moraxellaceae bacterium]|nr:hypothetical protein [Moraxellaceae bacterium]
MATACTINNQWIDYLGDGFSFTHIWRGQDAVYHDSDGWDKFGFTRVYKQHPDYSHITQCSSRLWATNAWNDDSVKGREPVLFVHGFKSSGNLGGFDGEEYFGRFPNLITQVNSLPFLFEWRTNARFEDVAAELGDAIKLISEKTGKKVHIVAHSFGGLLSRTLIQGLANVPNTQNVHLFFTAQWAEQNIATLTTVGTPHSGIAGGSDDAIEGLPNGRDGTEGAGITACYATTCYQAGRRGDLPFGNQTRHPFRSSVLVNGSGDIIRKLLHTPYPTGIYTQVLIGLGGFNDFGLDDSTTDASDIQITCSKTAENLAEGQCRLFYPRQGVLRTRVTA